MGILNSEELAAMKNSTGVARKVDKNVMFSALSKFDSLQRKLTDKQHIKAVNSNIEFAENWAKGKAVDAVKKNGGNLGDHFDKFFHRKMRELTADIRTFSTTKR